MLEASLRMTLMSCAFLNVSHQHLYDHTLWCHSYSSGEFIKLAFHKLYIVVKHTTSNKIGMQLYKQCTVYKKEMYWMFGRCNWLIVYYMCFLYRSNTQTRVQLKPVSMNGDSRYPWVLTFVRCLLVIIT